MSRQDTSSATKILWGQILIVSIVALLFVWAATQWVAFSSRVPTPAWRASHPPCSVCRSTARGRSSPGGTGTTPTRPASSWKEPAIAGAGGIAAIAVAILLSVLRARECGAT